MIPRPLALALAAAIATSAFAPTAAAEDLLQTYELARTGDPQLSAAESTRLATREGAVQARAAMLPQINGSATLQRSRTEGPSAERFQDPTNPTQSIVVNGDGETESTTRRLGIDLPTVVAHQVLKPMPQVLVEGAAPHDHIRLQVQRQDPRVEVARAH